MAGRVNLDAPNHRTLADLARASIAAGYAMAAETPLDPPREAMKPWLLIDGFLTRYLAWVASRPLALGARQQ